MVITQAVTAGSIKECALHFFDHVEVSSNFVYILFPELTVTNELDLSIDIQDLVVKLEYSILRDNKVMFENMQGLRIQTDLTQFLGYYSHSHLPKFGLDDFNRFCLGSDTPMKAALDTTEVDMDVVFGLVNSFVRNESVAGVPHVKLDTVLDLNNVLSHLLKSKVPTIRHISSIAKDMLENGNLSYQYVSDGILPRIKIRSGDDERLLRLLVDNGLGTDMSSYSMLQLMQKIHLSVREEDGEYHLGLLNPFTIDGVTIDRKHIIPTEEELSHIRDNVSSGAEDVKKAYKYLETFLNKYLNL
jgi:hypothetical protein